MSYLILKHYQTQLSACLCIRNQDLKINETQITFLKKDSTTFLNTSKARSESQVEHRNGKTLKIPKVLSPQKQVNIQTMDKLGRNETVARTNMEGE